jgi:hypothetical protein
MTAEAVLILLLVRVRAFRTLPAFFSYMCWSLLSDVLLSTLQSLPTATYFRIYEIQMVIDSAMIFAVLVELTWSVLRPIRGSLPKRAWIGIAVLIALAGLLLWPIAGFTVPVHKLSLAWLNFFRLQQTFAILRVVVFVGMAGFSQLLSIGWRDRELQVATGLGFYSIVALGVSVMQAHKMIGPQYHWLDAVVSASYLGAMVYWVFAFATKEAVRQNFTPQMQDLLLAVAGAARTTRVALTDSASAKGRKPGKR